MTLTYVLPSVSADPLPPPRKYAELLDVSNLSDIAASLNVPEGATSLVGIKSLPDPWAQVRLFSLSLTDDHDELHSDSVAKWRGLLALLALQPFFANQYALRVRTIDLADNSGPTRRFRRVLHDLTPESTLTRGMAWRQLSVLIFTDVSRGPFQAAAASAVGFLSPATLVAPGRTATSTSPLAHAHVPWLVSGLADPLACPGLSSQHYAALADYAREVANGLIEQDAPGHNAQRAAKLMTQLQRLHDGAQARIDAPTRPMVRAGPPLDWPKTRFYEPLGQGFQVDESKVPTGDSLCRLAIRSEAVGLVEGVVLVDETLARTIGRPAQDIPVFGRHSLAEALTPAGFQVIREQAAQAGVLVVRPDDFFTEQLVRLDGADAAPGNPPTFRSALLPLSPLALLVFTRSELAQAAELSNQGETAIVRLRLPLEADARRPRTNHHGLVRRYEGDSVFKADRPDSLSIWPDFEDEAWPWRFLHFTSNSRYYLHPRFGVSARFLKAEIETRAGSPQDRVAALLEWAAPHGLSIDNRLYSGRESTLKSAGGEVLMRRLRFLEKDDEDIGETQRLPLGVEAIFFSRRTEARKGSEEPAGCVFVAYKPITQQGHATATVSVDFGTTNTLAYVLRGGAIRPVAFADRLIFPLALTRDAARQRQELAPAYAEFFPLRNIPSPFPTVVKERRFDGKRPESVPLIRQGGSEDHGFSDSAFFVPDDRGGTSIRRLLAWIAAGELIFGLKWTVDPQLRMLIRRYLRQVIFMITAELYATGVAPQGIQWKFSYPEAFRPAAARNFVQFVRRAWREVFKEIPALAHTEPEEAVSTLTEGEALFRYFTSDRDQRYALRGDIMVMLDIGGGSTDIAISTSADGGIAWRGSFEIAGGHFFTRYLGNNPEILEQVSLGEVAGYIAAGAHADPDSFRGFIELFVSSPSFANDFEAAYTAISDVPVGRGLWSCAATALAGMLYYVGLVLGDALDNIEAQVAAEGAQDQGRLSRSGIRSVSFAFGGRGSTFFRQFADGASSDLVKVCRVFLAAAGLDDSVVDIETMFSRRGEAKHEVARGAVAPEANQPRSGTRFDAKPLGDAIVTGVGSLPATGRGGQVGDLFAQTTTAAGREVRSLDDTHLLRMLSLLAEKAGVVIDLASRNGAATVRERALSLLRDAMRRLEAEDREQGSPAASQSLPPPLIVEVAALVELLSMPNAERDRRLTVRERDV